MNLKQVKNLLYALAAACLLMILLLGITMSEVFLWLAVVLAVAVAAVNLTLWRCPRCGEHLGRGVGKYCAHCGKRIEDFE